MDAVQIKSIMEWCSPSLNHTHITCVKFCIQHLIWEHVASHTTFSWVIIQFSRQYNTVWDWMTCISHLKTGLRIKVHKIFVVPTRMHAHTHTQMQQKQIRIYLIIQCHQIQLQSGKLNLPSPPWNNELIWVKVLKIWSVSKQSIFLFWHCVNEWDCKEPP